jgi:sec-independent protein translocase protein TatA
MPQIGPLEILLVMVVALLVFGPEKLPEMARNLGRTATQLKRMAQDMKDEFATALDDDEDRPAPGASASRPRVAGALPADDDAASGTESDATADDESSSVKDDIEQLNSQQQDAETTAGSRTETTKNDSSE